MPSTNYQRWLSPALLLIGLAAISGAIAVCAVNRSATIHVGFLGTFCGASASTTAMARDGAMLAMAECNDGGGIRGSQVRLQIGDDAGSAARAATLVDGFVRDDCWAIIGPTAGSVLSPALTAASGRVVIITPTVDSDSSGGATSLFTIGPSESHTLEYAARYLYVQRHLRHPAVIVGGTATGVRQALGVFSSWMSGPDSGIARTIELANPSITFAETAREAAAASGDCVVVLASSCEAAVIIQHLRLAGCDLPVIVPQCLAVDELILYGGRAVEGATLFLMVDAEHPSNTYRGFADRFQRRFGYQPSPAAARGFEATRVALLAIGQAGSPSEVSHALTSRRSFEGLHGRIIFNESGDTIRELTPVQVRDGAVHTME